jgi:hypothetical protein
VKMIPISGTVTIPFAETATLLDVAPANSVFFLSRILGFSRQWQAQSIDVRGKPNYGGPTFTDRRYDRAPSLPPRSFFGR